MEHLSVAPITVDQRIARMIKLLLSSQKMTYREFAIKCDLPYRTVQNYLAGKARIPADFVAKACDVLGVEADFLIYNGVDVSRTAMLYAVQVALEGLLPNLELEGQRVRLRQSDDDVPTSDAKRQSLGRAVSMVVSATIRDEYISMRLIELRSRGDGGVSPEDAAREAFNLEHAGLISKKTRTSKPDQ